MGILDANFIQRFVRMAHDGWEQGWHEKNGGNLSYRMTDEDVALIHNYLHTDGAWIEIGTTVPDLAGVRYRKDRRDRRGCGHEHPVRRRDQSRRMNC